MFICLSLFLTIQSAYAQTGWQWQYPLPQGNTLYDVHYFNSSLAIAVGAVATVIITTNGGSSWAVTMNAAGLSATLRAVRMLDALTAVAVGDGGTIIRTADGGITWAAQASGTSADLNDVAFAGAGTGYIVGSAGTMLKTTDGGIGWIPLSGGSEALLHGVSFANSDIGTAVGSGGAILRTTDGGANWTGQTSGTTAALHAVQCISDSIVYAVGDDIVLKTTDGGTIWNILATPYWWSPVLEDLSFTRGPEGLPDEGFIVGNILGQDEEPSLFAWLDAGGPNWAFSTPPNFVFGVSMLDIAEGLGVGKNGMIRRISYGGAPGSVIGGPPLDYHMSSMGGVDFCGVYKGVAVTSTNVSSTFNTSTVLRTTDGGATWSAGQVETGQGVRLLDIALADETTAYAVGHGFHVYDFGAVIYRSSDGGGSWEEYWSCLCWPGNPDCIWSFHGVDFADADHGIIIGSNGAVVMLRSGGANQTAAGTGMTLSVAAGTGVALSAVSMPDSVTVFGVGGGGTILRSTDGGNTWVPQASGVSASLNGVHFCDADNGTVVGSGGTILRTWNGGDNWYPQTSGTTANLLRVSFSSPLVGFIVGQSGTILGTIDGGVTWTAELSPIEELVDLHTINQYNLTIVGGNWNILAKRDEATVSVFSAVLAARPSRTCIRLEWSIDGDERIRGLHMYRRGGSTAEYARLNDGLIPKDSRTFTDQTVQPGTRYEYVLGVGFDDGSEVRSNMASAELPIGDIELLQNYPNPFNPATTIRFSLPETQRAKLVVYDVSGHLVAILVDRILSFGDHAVEWDTRNEAGRAVSSGVYYYRLVTDKRKITRKMLLLR